MSHEKEEMLLRNSLGIQKILALQVKNQEKKRWPLYQDRRPYQNLMLERGSSM